MKSYLAYLVLLVAFDISYNMSFAQTNLPDTLHNKFVTPPRSAEPRVWWHWMNGNITKDGIRKDLLWMKRSGIGGMQAFDASVLTPQIVKERLVYMTPHWKDAFRYTAHLADSLQLELAIAGSPGWSESGGPWVLPKDGMKKVVWSEITVDRKNSTIITVPKPPSVTGMFQTLPFVPDVMAPRGLPVPQYYQDIAVIAFKISDDSLTDSTKPIVTSGGGKLSLEQLKDENLPSMDPLSKDTTSGYAWIQFTYNTPQIVRGVTVAGGGITNAISSAVSTDSRFLQSSDDGVNFHTVASLPVGKKVEQSISVPKTTAKYFRVIFKSSSSTFVNHFGGNGGDIPESPRTTDIVLNPESVVDRFEEKAGFVNATDLYKHPTPESDDAVPTTNIINLTSKMSPEGVLAWTPPEGQWKIIRFGFSLTGMTNHPATAEATGLEVDKLDPIAVSNYFTHYLDMYKDATNGLIGAKGLNCMVTDSYEAGTANWTPNLPNEFEKRRGYSLIPWMPVLAGHVIQSAKASDQFLWDFRKTLGELIAANHYDLLTTILHRRGMKRYSESHEDGRDFVGDGMEVKRTADIPMSAMWVPTLKKETFKYRSDIRESASVAHLYGQNIAAAESFTVNGLEGTAWAYSPENLKPTADLEMACGLNRFVVHTSVHQSTDDKIPGINLGPFGQWFNRHDTWAEKAKVWTDYLSRSCYMLQQGKFVADVIYYYGEDNNITALYDKKLPNVPDGYNYDFVNADALVNLLSVKNGNIITPSGMQYKVLALDSNSMEMSLTVLKKINQLIRDGATIVGPRPVETPSLADNKAEYKSILNTMWPESSNGIIKIGLGKIIADANIASALKIVNVEPDFSCTKSDPAAEIFYVHRKLPVREIYWISNHSNKSEDLDCNFRVSGKSVELWHAETGKIEPCAYSFANGRTKVSIHMEPNDAVFVIFSGKTAIAKRNIPAVKETQLASVDGPWTVNFQKDLGAPAVAKFDSLKSWAENFDDGIRYFSGTATYKKQIKVESAWLKSGSHIWLDLGQVANIAEVRVNGKSVGTVWRKPFKVELSRTLKTGENSLEISVTNLWVNRLIGDRQSNAIKYTYTGTFTYYNSKSPLLPSGLMGPVKIFSINQVNQ